MRILLISFEFPPQPGGIGTYSYQIAKNLSNFGNKITALVHSHDVSNTVVQEFDSRQPFKLIRYKNTRCKLLKIFYRTIITWKIFRNNRFDLLFFPYPNAGVLGLVFKKLFGMPYIMIGHGSEFLYKNLILKYGIKTIYKNANGLLVNSHYTARLVRDLNIPDSKVKIIPLGASDDVYDYKNINLGKVKEKYKLTNRKIVLTVSGLRKLKGHRHVVEAIDIIKNEIPEILYLIIGCGEEQQNLEKLIIQKGLEHYVRLEGSALWTKLRDYYALCDVFILASTMESFGIVFVEAGLMGKPVIGTRVCAIPEVVEDGKSGILVPPQNPRMIAEALKKLLKNNELRKEMGEYGYQRAKENFTWKKVAEKTESVLKTINYVNKKL